MLTATRFLRQMKQYFLDEFLNSQVHDNPKMLPIFAAKKCKDDIMKL